MILKKNKIKSFIKQYRRSKVIQTLLERVFFLFGIFLILFISFIFLEQYIYFQSNNRIRIIILLIGFLLSLSITIIAHFYLQLKGRIEGFSNEDITTDVGEKELIADKLTNAYQLSQIELKNELSEQLANSAIYNVQKKISNITIPSILKAFQTKLFYSMLLILLCFIGFLFNNQFNNATERLLHPNKSFNIPVPFSFIDFTEDIMLLEGDSLDIIFKIEDGKAPDSINIIIEKYNQLSSVKVPYHNKEFVFRMKNIIDDFSYWGEHKSDSYFNAWDKIKSTEKDVYITKRPRINSINFTVIPPIYSKLKQTHYTANNTDISMLQGSLLQIKAMANKKVKKSWLLLNNIKKDLSSFEDTISGEIQVDTSLIISMLCEDINQIKNINPPTNRINVIPDYKPQIFVESPEKDFEINDNRIITIDMQIIDDFGFSDGWIEYRIIRPEYLSTDSTVYKFHIRDINPNLKAQRIINEWDISSYPLASDEKIEFYLMIADNNNITGPSIAKLGPFIGKIPSLEDLFMSISNMEGDIVESTDEITLTIDEVQELVDDLEKELLKSDEVSWEQVQKVNETSNKIDEILNEIESINEALENIQEEMDNNDLVDQNLMNKFQEFQDLLNSIMTPEMLETLNKIKEMMNQMTTDQMLGEIKNLKQDISMLDEQLDRFIELFQRAMAEQAFDEFIKKLEEMLTEQLNISNDITKNEPDYNNLEIREDSQIYTFNIFKNSIENYTQTISKFSEKSGMRLEELLNSELAINTQNSLELTKESLGESNSSSSFSNSEKAITNLEEMLNEIEEIKEEFNRESVDKMTSEFITLIRNIESISFDQEVIINQSGAMKQYNPKLVEIALKENIIQRKIIKFIEQLMILSNKTLHIPPTINKTIGSAQLAIQKSISLIEQKRTRQAITENKKALSSINETAYILITALEKMQNTMLASGMASYLEQLEQMAKEQKQINQGTDQCMMPGGGMPGQMNLQEALMQRLQAQQKALQEQLGEMLSENPGEQSGEGLSKAMDDMEEVIKDFKRKKIDRETIERQEKILSRMLDSQKSLKQKDYNEKRKSKTAEKNDYDGPTSLPDDKGERQTILTNALEDALNQGYSTDYQIIMKKYFKYLEQ